MEIQGHASYFHRLLVLVFLQSYISKSITIPALDIPDFPALNAPDVGAGKKSTTGTIPVVFYLPQNEFVK